MREDKVEDRALATRHRRLELVVATLASVLGLGLTAVAGAALVNQPGVYWASQRVTIQAPKSADNPNTFQISLRSINMTAGVVAQLVDGDHRAERAVEPEMPLANLGVRSGWTVQQPDRGGQWSHQYSDPYVTIQAVDPDPERVQQMMETLEGRVVAAIDGLQDEADVAPVNRFTTTTSPPAVNLYHQTGSRTRTLAGTALLGLGLTLALVRASVWLVRRRVATTPEATPGAIVHT